MSNFTQLIDIYLAYRKINWEHTVAGTSGCSLEKCAQVASVLAGYVIQTVGTTLSPKVWDEIKLNVGAILQGDAE